MTFRNAEGGRIQSLGVPVTRSILEALCLLLFSFSFSSPMNLALFPALGHCFNTWYLGHSALFLVLAGSSWGHLGVAPRQIC